MECITVQRLISRLKALRVERGLTQEEFAELAGQLLLPGETEPARKTTRVRSTRTATKKSPPTKKSR
jgi:transcriptional regulator with XRE-family HTH domain